jgi:Family of unknown function (DUF5320)
MPGRDRTGPAGDGPRTGKRLGLCVQQGRRQSETEPAERLFVWRNRGGRRGQRECQSGYGRQGRGFGWRMMAELFSRGGSQ